MSISGVMSSAVSALNANTSKVAATADNIVNADTEGYKARQVRTTTLVTKQATSAYSPGGVQSFVQESGQVNMANEFVNLILARTAYGFGTEVVNASEDMANTLVDIKA